MMHAPDDIDIRSKMKESDRNHLETVSNNDGGKLEGEGRLPHVNFHNIIMMP